jgi:hypothetical protein
MKMKKKIELLEGEIEKKIIQLKNGPKKCTESTKINLTNSWLRSWDQDNLIKRRSKNNYEAQLKKNIKK